jgi:tol-pal system-associated acyl-CoA thioesterase
MSNTFHFQVQIYYEDTDHSGFVYHANYFKYFERAREQAIGRERMLDFWHQQGVGFVVYKLDAQFSEGCEFGDLLDIRSTYEMEGDYRINWHHEVWRPTSKKAAVKATVQLVCLNHDKQLVPIPRDVGGG